MDAGARLDDTKGYLAKILGEQKAADLLRDCLRDSGLIGVTTPDDLLRVAESLIAQGGVVCLIGRSLKVQAILAGAKISEKTGGKAG